MKIIMHLLLLLVTSFFCNGKPELTTEMIKAVDTYVMLLPENDKKIALAQDIKAHILIPVMDYCIKNKIMDIETCIIFNTNGQSIAYLIEDKNIYQFKFIPKKYYDLYKFDYPIDEKQTLYPISLKKKALPKNIMEQLPKLFSAFDDYHKGRGALTGEIDGTKCFILHREKGKPSYLFEMSTDTFNNSPFHPFLKISGMIQSLFNTAEKKEL